MTRFLIAAIVTALTAPSLRAQSGNDLFQQALSKEQADGQLDDAIQIYERIVKQFATDRPLAARALVQMGRCYERLGKADARTAYERVIQEYGDQRATAAEARTRLAALQSLAAGGMTARRLWSGSDEVYGPPSADGRYVSIVDASTGNVGVIELSTGRRHLLTKAAAGEGAVASIIAPDGKQVVYSWYGSYGTFAGDAFELRACATDGTAPRVLYRNPEIAYVYPADWSADGRRLLLIVARKDRTKQIAIFDVGAATLRVLKTTDWNGPGGAMFSPDARYLVYDLPQGPDTAMRDVFVMAADGSHETALVRHPANDRVLGWMPDGKRILIQSDRSRSIDAWVIQVADGKPVGLPELVKRDLGRISPMGFSRSGAYYYVVNTTLREIYVASVDFRDGRIDAAPAAAVPNFAGQKQAGDWSPSGLALAYAPLRQAGQPGLPILIRDLASGDERELKTTFTYVMKLRWSPDGGSLAFRATDVTHGWGIHRIDARTGIVTPIDTKAGSVSDLAWSPDGARIFYARLGKVFARDAATGDVKLVFEGSPTQWATWLAISPDGATLAVTDQNDEAHWTALKILPAAGGAARELLRVQAPGGIPGGLAWSRDGQNLLIARSDTRSSQIEQRELWRVPIDGGRPQRLGLSGIELTDLRLHPDGRQVAYTAGEYRAEIWVLENFLPAAKTTAARR